MNKQVIDFWSAENLQATRNLILFGANEEQWCRDTVELMPRLLTPTVLTNLPGKDLCIEIGAGIGRILEPMTKCFKEAIGVDISPVMVAYSKGYLKDVPNAWVELTEGTLPFANEIADFVYSYICFQHLQSYDEVKTYLKESKRILKDGGVILVQTHCGEPNKGFDRFHGCFYQSLGKFVQEFEEAGFVVLEATRGITGPDTLWVTAKK